MPPRSQPSPPEVTTPAPPPEVTTPAYVREIAPDSYGTRQVRHVVRDLVEGRGSQIGVIKELRDRLTAAAADGKIVEIRITTK